MGQLIGLGLVLLAHFTLPFDRQPLYPWARINSGAYIIVTNLTLDTLRISVTAPEVDDATRALGRVAPCSTSEPRRLPYADTRVRLRLATATQSTVATVDDDRPGIWNVSVGLDARCLTELTRLVHWGL